MLLAFTKYDSTVGYVQGMNFVVAALLLHCAEEIAFWLFVSIIEDYEMRDIYRPRLPGLYKHTQIINMLMFTNVRQIYQHFVINGIRVEMFATNWIFTLFASIVPINQMGMIFDEFFRSSWIFVYKLALHLLRSNEKSILATDDISAMISPMKDAKPKSVINGLLSSLPFFNGIFRQASWREVIRESNNEVLDEDHIKALLDSYDLENMRFKYNYMQ